MSKTQPTKEEPKAANPPPVPEQTKPENHPDTSFADSMKEAGNGGFENVNPLRDLQTPYLQIVQAGSPERKKTEAKYIQGAEEGDVFNSVTRQLYKTNGPEGEKIVVIPCGFMRVWNIWRLRNKGGGGFVKSILNEKEVPKTIKGDENGKPVADGRFNLLSENNDFNLVETAVHSVLVLSKDGSRYPALMSMTSSQLTKSRTWLSIMAAKRICDSEGKSFRPPSFANRYAVETVVQTQKGTTNTFFNWKIEDEKQVSQEEFQEAFAFNKATAGNIALPAPPSDGEDLGDTDRPY